MPRKLKNCNNFQDLKDLARRRLPGPIYHYIDGAAEDETTYQRNTEAFHDVDLVPNVLAGVENIDMSVKVMGYKLGVPIFCSPTALQRLFHHQGERAVAKAAEKYNTLFGVSSLGTVKLKDIDELIDTPKMFQFYFHKDRGLNDSMIIMAQEANFEILTLTVDTITGGNRERDLRTGFTTPPKLTPKSIFQFGIKPAWALNYLFREKFELSQLSSHVNEGTNISISVGDYFTTMLDQSMTWDDVIKLRENWGRKFCLKGIMSPGDARKAVEMNADAIMVSNHGGRQLDGGRSSFDQLDEILQEVGGEIEVILDGGIQRGTHVLKALAMGATACSGGRMYLFGLAAAGQQGVEKALGNMKNEIERDMKLMGVKKISELNPSMIRFR
ncbi:MAG: alpha-hydroxy-acid oxidizing protein [Gammaproteobacteria bacterium]|nr:MAG: alpha-hydroxy-acid oxidizing protein [Gammaproteobacteria bacterium]|tara:strand:+ start:2082 stop:3236 length:1155 start_codon:yes stop_codon:yes gene_type:complete